MPSLFGEIVSPWDVEQAAVKTLSIWMNEYLAEIERKRGLAKRTIPRIPTPESVHGGPDLERWEQAIMPEVIVVCKTVGGPELRGSGGYAQGYDLTVGCLWIGQGSTLAEAPWEEPRAVASYLGAASMLLVQQPTLGGLTERLVMTVPPSVTVPDPDRRNIALATTQFTAWVATIIEEGKGPINELPAESPFFNGVEEEWKEEPEVKTTSEPVKAVRVSETV